MCQMRSSAGIMLGILLAPLGFTGFVVGQVVSTWTNAAGNSSWTDPGNWSHSVPDAQGNWPKNGNGGYTYHPTIDLAANVAINEPIELDALSVLGFNRFIIGEAEITVTGQSVFSGFSGFGGGGGMFKPQGGLSVPSGTFRITGWTMAADQVALGSSAIVSLHNGAQVNLNGTLTFDGSGGITSDLGSQMKLAGGAMIDKGGQAGTVGSVIAPLQIDGGALRSTAGELRIGPVFQYVGNQSIISTGNVDIGAGAQVTFDSHKVAIFDTLNVASAADGILKFNNCTVELHAALVGDAGPVVLAGGTLEGFNSSSSFILQGDFVLDGGGLKGMINNDGGFLWRRGQIAIGASFTNQANMPGAARLEQQNGERKIFGTLINDTGAIFTHANGSLDVQGFESKRNEADGGAVTNRGLWLITGGTGMELSGCGGGFVNTANATFHKAFDSSNNHFLVAFEGNCFPAFDNQGTVICEDNELRFDLKVVKQFDLQSGTINGGTWKTINDGKIVFINLPSGGVRFGPEAKVEQVGPGSQFHPINTLKDNQGTLTLANGNNQSITPPDGTLTNTGICTLDDAALTVNGTVVNGDPSTKGYGTIDLTELSSFACNGITNHGGSTVSTSSACTFVVDGDVNNAGSMTINGPLTVQGNVYNRPLDDFGGAAELDINLVASALLANYVENKGTMKLDAVQSKISANDFKNDEDGLFFLLNADLPPLLSEPAAPITITNVATLDGALIVELAAGYTPQIGDTLPIISAGSIVGEFATLDLPALDQGEWEISYSQRDVTLSVVPANACHGDLTGNGGVDVQDLLTLLGAWGPCPGACPADINGTGTVDVQDLLLLLSTWGPCQ